ncbi:hypothetical protein EDM57_00280 [Brevibacillus gelatini]|uniref:Abortive phage infection protein C-terminal domain-containing protein n=1 Tax=Brevibacillus gelatini TaxID=1655277 RepID=A0A3M8BF41_9BACL|nr:AIPR family protein [Brevibacillus gelatini]RNB62029.1 hypothetical protein EDM57_00280 [Brevibacillus gelatini]
MSGFFSSFMSREDLIPYGDNALLLYALELKWHIEDIATVATQALTDGSDDKKCDLIYVDRINKIAVVAQGYYTEKEKQSAPANKASDLNTAVAWVLSMDVERLPERIKAAAIELRQALTDDEIEAIEFWYVHNLPHSQNVREELDAVEHTAMNALKANFPNSNCRTVKAIEVGHHTLEEWYKATQTAILVNEEFTIEITGGYHQESDKWKAFATSVPAKWLADLQRRYPEDLFSANVRYFLGAKKGDSPINAGIQETVSTSPSEFWVYNNGITALVHHFDVIDDKLIIKGISIVNGAQTTGSLGSTSNPIPENTMVPARFIKCDDESIIRNIIKYNNSQNEIEPEDFRSTDGVQQRLRSEFSSNEFFSYTGARRGGVSLPKEKHLIPAGTVSQAIAAFYGEPELAYHRAKEIWEKNTEYEKIFSEKTHADHMIFVYSLYKTIVNYKAKLMKMAKTGSTMNQAEEKSLEFLRNRGAIYLLTSAISASLGLILKKSLTNIYDLRFNRSMSLEECERLWEPIVLTCISFRDSLNPALAKGMKNIEENKKAIDSFTSFVEVVSQQELLVKSFEVFASHVVIESVV